MSAGSFVSNGAVPVTVILAYDNTGLIGRCGGKLPWRCSADLQRFKKLSLGPPTAVRPFVIMGRKTYESIRDNRKAPLAEGDSLLPGRRVAVLSLSLAKEKGATRLPGDAAAFDSLKAIADYIRSFAVPDLPYVTVAGGAQVYELFLSEVITPLAAGDALERPTEGLFTIEAIETSVFYYPFIPCEDDVRLESRVLVPLNRPHLMGFRSENTEYLRQEEAPHSTLKFSRLVRMKGVC